MAFVEILIGVGIGVAIIAGATTFAFRTPKNKGLSRHGIRGNGDYADGHVRTKRGFDGGDGGDGGAD